MDDYTSQLLRLRSTIKLGALHEGHIQQLRLMPYAVDPTIEKHVVEVLTDHEGTFLKIVRYKWDCKRPMKVDSFYLYRLAEFEKAVKFMFGDDWQLEITRNGKRLKWADAPATDPRFKPRAKRAKAKGTVRKRKPVKRGRKVRS